MPAPSALYEIYLFDLTTIGSLLVAFAVTYPCLNGAKQSDIRLYYLSQVQPELWNKIVVARMLETKVYTPRSSFEHERDLPGFLRMPVELRIQIYEQVFTDVRPRPLIIRHYPGHEWLYRRPKSRDHIPGLLFLNKQIHIEARDVLHNLCFANADQPVAIEHIQLFAASRPVMEPRDWNNFCIYRSVREIAPVLQSLPRIRLEVEVAGNAYEEQAHTIALLRWVRAVLNERPSTASVFHVPLQSFDVIFCLPLITQQNFYQPEERHGLVQAIIGVKGVMEESQVWFSWASQRPANRRKVKVTAGERLIVRNPPFVGWEGEASTWEGVKKAWKLVKAEEAKRMWKTRRELILELDWTSSLGRRVQRLFGG